MLTQVQRAEVLYWKADSPEKFSPDHFPILVYENAVEKMDKFYAFPEYEYPGLIKVCSIMSSSTLLVQYLCVSAGVLPNSS